MGLECHSATSNQVFLFYLLVEGDNVHMDDYGRSGMTGAIITYRHFLHFDEKELCKDYDIVIAGCVGKDEVEKPVSFRPTHELCKLLRGQGILDHWQRMRRLETKIPIWPSVAEQLRHYGKKETEEDLDHISRNVTHTHRPQTIWETPKSPSFVAKRYAILEMP
jgi:hypothetical protein